MVKPVEKKIEVPAVQSQSSDKDEKKEEDTGPAPIGNGGTTDKYTWTQTLTELHMYIPVSSEVTSKQIKVTISLQHLNIVISG